MLFLFSFFLFFSPTFVDVKVEIKTEEPVPEPVSVKQDDNQGAEHQQGQDGNARAEQVKVEADKGGNYSRKRPYEENRSYGYYEHREEKRWVLRA